jgi:hypothetical protein
MKRWTVDSNYSNYFFSIEIDIQEDEAYACTILDFLAFEIKRIAKEARDMADSPVRIKVEV